MKKIFALVLALCMVFALTACGGNADEFNAKLGQISTAVKGLQASVDASDQ